MEVNPICTVFSVAEVPWRTTPLFGKEGAVEFLKKCCPFNPPTNSLNIFNKSKMVGVVSYLTPAAQLYIHVLVHPKFSFLYKIN
jgi:hypothetical protein